MHRHIITALALAGTAITAVAAAAPVSLQQMHQLRELRFNAHLPIGRSEPRPKRSRGKQAHPKRRRNGVTLSRRVRRKHRRAA